MHGPLGDARVAALPLPPRLDSACLPAGLQVGRVLPYYSPRAAPPLRVPQQVGDEYGSGRPVMLYALRPAPAVAAAACGVASPAADDPAEQRRRLLNEGLSLSLLAPLCSTFTPLALPVQAPGVLPLLRWQQGSAFHASALCAAALDTATLPYRLLASGLSPAAATGEPAGIGW